MRFIGAVLLAILLTACAMPRSLPAATGLVGANDAVVVIGKFELVPKLEPELEQRRHRLAVGQERLLQHLWVATGSEPRALGPDGVQGGDFQEAIEAEWGVPFMVNAPRRRTYLNGAVAHLDVVLRERLWFPGGVYFEVPAGARAVYIGTLRYHRNDFNKIVRVEVIDERGDLAKVLESASDREQVRTWLLRPVAATR